MALNEGKLRRQRRRLYIPANQLSGLGGPRLIDYAPGGGDIKGATAIAGSDFTADKNADMVNTGIYIAAQTFGAVDGNAGDLGALIAQPDVARAVGISIINDSGGPLDMYVGTTTFTITGTFRGQAQVEQAVAVVLDAAKTVADGKFRWLRTTKPFDTIASITMNHSADWPATLKVAVGPSSQLGLPVAPANNAASDFVKLTVNGANMEVVSEGVYSTIYGTLDVGTTADGADVGVVYNAAGGALVSAGAGLPALIAIGTTGLTGLLMRAAGDDIRHAMPIPADLDRYNPVRMRVWWSSEAAAVGARTIDWKVLYKALTSETSALAAGDTALSTAIARDTPVGTAKVVQKTAWGVLNRNTITTAQDMLSLIVEMDAFNAAFVENKYLLGLELEYSPKGVSGATRPRLEAEAVEA